MMKFFSKFKTLPQLERISISLSLFCLILSFPADAFYVSGRYGQQAWGEGLSLYFGGTLGFMSGSFWIFIIWYANPLYILSIVSILKGNIGFALILLIFATIMAFGFSFLDVYHIPNDSEYFSPDRYKIISLGPGYFLWLSSFFILTIGTGVRYYYNS